MEHSLLFLPGSFSGCHGAVTRQKLFKRRTKLKTTGNVLFSDTRNQNLRKMHYQHVRGLTEFLTTLVDLVTVAEVTKERVAVEDGGTAWEGQKAIVQFRTSQFRKRVNLLSYQLRLVLHDLQDGAVYRSSPHDLHGSDQAEIYRQIYADFAF